MRNQSVCVCMYVCRCLTNLHLPPEDPTSCHEETPNSRTQCCSEDFCNTHQNYKGPIPGESCLPPPPPPAPPRPHTRPSHAPSCLIHRHICERNILTTSHLRPRAPPFVRQLNHAHVIAPHHLRFLDRILWHTRITHTPVYHISITHTLTYISVMLHAVDCPAASRPLPTAPCSAPCTCNMCVLCLRFLGFLIHTHTHALHTHTCICCCCVSSPCLRLHTRLPPLGLHAPAQHSLCLLTFRIIHIDLLKTRRNAKQL